MTDATATNILTLQDVALLLAGKPDQIPRDTARRMAEVIRTEPRYAERVEELRTLAREAGFEPVRDEDLETALDSRRDLERLLTAEGWEHPAEVLDPQGEIGISYRELACLAAARAEREEGRGRARAVQEKLERAWASQREREAPVVRFVTRLLEHDEETAEALLQQAAVEHRRQRRQAAG